MLQTKTLASQHSLHVWKMNKISSIVLLTFPLFIYLCITPTGPQSVFILIYSVYFLYNLVIHSIHGIEEVLMDYLPSDTDEEIVHYKLTIQSFAYIILIKASQVLLFTVYKI